MIFDRFKLLYTGLGTDNVIFVGIIIILKNEVLDMSRIVIKPTKWHVRPVKTQISLGIRPVRSKSSLCA